MREFFAGLTTVDLLALLLGLGVGGFIAGYKFIPDRIFRSMDERDKR